MMTTRGTQRKALLLALAACLAFAAVANAAVMPAEARCRPPIAIASAQKLVARAGADLCRASQ